MRSASVRHVATRSSAPKEGASSTASRSARMDIGLVGQFVTVLQRAFPKLAPVMHHARVVTELRLERALDHRNQQVAMLADEGIIAGPVPVAAEQVEQLTRLIKLLAVRSIEALSDHSHAITADHLGEHVLERVVRGLEMSGVESAQSGVRAVPDPLRAVLEQAAVHCAVRADHGRQPESGLIKYLLSRPTPRRAGGNRRPDSGRAPLARG